MSEVERSFARIRLAGERFSGGRLPVDALEEIQRYQSLVIEAARREWIEAHPDEELPEDFASSLKLVITEVANGSAQVLLERETVQDDPYEAIFYDARDEVSRELSALLDATESIASAPLFEQKDFRSLGSSLRPGDSIQLTSYSRDKTPKVQDTIAVSAEQITQHFPRRVRQSDRERRRRAKELLHRSSQAIAGRLVALDADRRSFKLRSLHYGNLTGSYIDDSMTADLRAVLNASAKAPVIRIKADIQFRNGEAWRIRNASDVELFEVDGQPWSRKLVELASLGPDWDGELPGASMISFAALDAARDLVLKLVEADQERPGIFPTEEGGVSLEWADARSVANIEISSDATVFEMYYLPEGQSVGIHSEASTIADAVQFVREVSEK